MSVNQETSFNSFLSENINFQKFDIDRQIVNSSEEAQELLSILIKDVILLNSRIKKVIGNQIIEKISNTYVLHTLSKHLILNENGIKEKYLCESEELIKKRIEANIKDLNECLFKDSIIEKESLLDKVTFNQYKISKDYSSENCPILKEGIYPFYDRKIQENLILQTNISEEYRKDHWDMHSMLRDFFQNHLPTDSWGSIAMIYFFKTDIKKWLTLYEAIDIKNSEFSAVAFGDNGVGFDKKNLFYLHSLKSNLNELGQFGEGLKMACATSLRLDIPVILCSNNWRARPQLQVDDMVNFKTLEKKEIQSLQYEYVEFDHCMTGSRTIFPEATSELIQCAKNLMNDMLYLNRDYAPEEFNDKIELINFGFTPARIYHKGGIIVKDNSKNAVFSYNLQKPDRINDVNRKYIKPDEYKYEVQNLISNLNSYESIYHLLKTLLNDKLHGEEFIEINNNFGTNIKRIDLWKKAFYEIVAEKNITIHMNNLAKHIKEKLNEHNIQTLCIDSYGLYKTLKNIGIPLSEDKFEEISIFGIETGIFYEEMEPLKASELAVFSIIREHLNNAKTTKDVEINVVFEKGYGFDEEYFNKYTIGDRICFDKNLNFRDYYDIDFHMLSHFKIEPTIIITTNNYVYNKSILKIADSSAKENKVLFKKGISVAVPYCKQITHESLNWKVKGCYSETIIDSKKRSQLILKGEESASSKNSTVTKISNLSQPLWESMQTVFDTFLQLQPNYENNILYEDKNLNVTVFKTLKNEPKRIYIDNILLKNLTEKDQIFSYNIKWNDEISHYLLFENYKENGTYFRPSTKDFNIIFSEIILKLLKETNNKYIIKDIINKAHNNEYSNCVELQAFHPKYPAIWREAFFNIFDKNTVLNTSSLFYNLQAELLGYKPIDINKNIYLVLQKSGINTSKYEVETALKQYENVNLNELNDSEKKMLLFIKILDKICEEKKDHISSYLLERFQGALFDYPKEAHIRVFSSKIDSVNADGFFYRIDQNGDITSIIGLNRDCLSSNNTYKIISTYFSQKSKQILQGFFDLQKIPPGDINKRSYNEHVLEVYKIITSSLLVESINAKAVEINERKEITSNYLLVEHNPDDSTIEIESTEFKKLAN